MPGASEATDIAHLGDKHPGHDTPDAVDALDRFIAAMDISCRCSGRSKLGISVATPSINSRRNRTHTASYTLPNSRTIRWDDFARLDG